MGVQVAIVAALAGRTAVVTGAGRGIGRAVALALASSGAAVVVNDLIGGAAEETARRIVRDGGQAIAQEGDVSRGVDVNGLFAAAVERFNRVDIVVNNAGILTRSSLADLPEQDWDRVMAVNLRGTFLCSRAAARLMIPQRSGRIVNVASGRAFAGSTEAPHYAATKAGIIGFSKSLALELAPYRVQVNVVAPGLIDTDQPRSALMDDEFARAVAAIPLGRAGQPDDVAGAVLFLCGDRSGFITGATLLVNGGALLV